MENKLASYLKAAGKTQSSFAATVGVTQGALSKLCGQGQPSLETALRIERETDAAVAVEDWPAFAGLRDRAAQGPV